MVKIENSNYKLWIEGDVLFTEFLGSWDKEDVLSLEQDLKKLVKNLPKEWASFNYHDDYDLCTPEAFSVFESLASWAVENGLKRSAAIYQNSYVKDVLLKKLVDQEKRLLVKIFEEPKEAAQWLTKKGFPTYIK